MPSNQIITLTVITIGLLICTLIAIAAQTRPGTRCTKKIEKYTAKIYSLRDQYKFYETNDNYDSYESYEKRKKIFRKEKRAYKRLAYNIKRKLIRIMRRNKDIRGEKIIHDKEERDGGIERLKHATMGETSQKEGTHTINKSAIYLCDPHHPDDSTLAHVIIHEYAHVINDTIGHDEKWTRLFDTLQDAAHKEGWFNRYKQVQLHTYCGGKYNR